MRVPLLSRLFGAARSATATPVIGPVIDRDFPDPDVLAEGGRFYAYSTNSFYGGALVNVPVQRAEVLGGPWTVLGDAMPRPGSWVADGAHGGPNVWAPEIARTGAGYLLYYTAHHAALGVQCIGAATATAPAGPFEPLGRDALVGRRDDGDTIDPESFVDTDGSRCLIYKSGRVYSTMWLQRMGADGLTPVGERVELFRSDRPEEANIVEAPSLVRHGDRYVLFYSANTFDSGDYFVNYAIAPRVTGPYTKAAGRWLTSATIGGAYRNPGHEAVVCGPHGDHLVFHASLDATTRAMFAVGLGWSPDGVPRVRLDAPLDVLA